VTLHEGRGGPPPDLLAPPERVPVDSDIVDPAGWIFSQTTDTVVIPLLLCTIGT